MRTPSGYTLLEMLVVLGIIAILLGLLGFAAVRLREGTKKRAIAATILNLKAAMSMYKQEYQAYPSRPLAHPDTWPDPYEAGGVELNGWFLNHTSLKGKFAKREFDQKDPSYLIDPWGRRLRYRKSGPERILIWSLGPDGVDQIGQGKLRRAGDDISSDSVQ